MKNKDENKLIVFTGGHHSSALPVVELLIKNYPQYKILWLGHKHSLKNDKNTTLEYKEITSLNIPFIDLKAGKFFKTFDPVRIAKIPFGFFQSIAILMKYRPVAIMSFGGYLAVPVVLAGKLLRIPIVTHEQTLVLGYANLLISKFADKILVSWPKSLEHFPKWKSIYTGIPVRKAIFEPRSNNLDMNSSLPYIYITAGKSGSHKINLVIKEILPQLLAFCNIVLQTGDYSEFSDYDDISNIYQKCKTEVSGKLFLRKYVLEDEIGEVFSKASLIISRAGAHICTEIIALAKPAILIPIPWVSHNEQFLNAQMVKNSGLGEIIEEKTLSGNLLLMSIKNMLSELTKYKIKESISLKSYPEELIIKELVSVIKEK